MVLRIIFFLVVSCSVAKAQVVLVADSLIGLPGSFVEAPVKVVNWQDLVSCQGTIEWDTSVLTYDTVYQYGLPGMNQSNFGLSLLPSGKLTFSWNESNLQGVTLADSTPIFVLRFELIGLPGTASPIAFTTNPTNIEFINSQLFAISYNLVDGEIQIEDTTTVGVEEFSGDGFLEDGWGNYSWTVYPNPVREHSVIQWQGNGDEVNWKLLDMAGGIVKAGKLDGFSFGTPNGQALENNMQSGVSKVQWNKLIKAPLSDGVYWLEWDTEGERKMKKVFIEAAK